MKLKTVVKQMITSLSLVLTLSLVQAQDSESAGVRDVDRTGSDCIWIRTIRDYTPLDDRNLLIRGAANRSYLVTLVYRSFDMRSSMGLGFSSRDDQLCPYGGDAIVFDGLSREQIRILSITEVNKDEAEQLLVRFHRKEPAEPQTPAAEPVEGAAVEELD